MGKWSKKDEWIFLCGKGDFGVVVLSGGWLWDIMLRIQMTIYLGLYCGDYGRTRMSIETINGGVLSEMFKKWPLRSISRDTCKVV